MVLASKGGCCSGRLSGQTDRLFSAWRANAIAAADRDARKAPGIIDF
jgi:hypothetical protein